MDYINVLIHVPLYLYHLLAHIAQIIASLPWPTGDQVFGSTVLLLVMYIPRLVLYIMLPEDKVAYIIRTKVKHSKKQTFIPSSHDHKAGIAAVASESVFHHF